LSVTCGRSVVFSRCSKSNYHTITTTTDSVCRKRKYSRFYKKNKTEWTCTTNQSNLYVIGNVLLTLILHCKTYALRILGGRTPRTPPSKSATAYHYTTKVVIFILAWHLYVIGNVLLTLILSFPYKVYSIWGITKFWSVHENDNWNLYTLTGLELVDLFLAWENSWCLVPRNQSEWNNLWTTDGEHIQRVFTMCKICYYRSRVNHSWTSRREKSKLN
jgi:hypothetical protein